MLPEIVDVGSAGNVGDVGNVGDLGDVGNVDFVRSDDVMVLLPYARMYGSW